MRSCASRLGQHRRAYPTGNQQRHVVNHQQLERSQRQVSTAPWPQTQPIGIPRRVLGSTHTSTSIKADRSTHGAECLGSCSPRRAAKSHSCHGFRESTEGDLSAHVTRLFQTVEGSTPQCHPQGNEAGILVLSPKYRDAGTGSQLSSDLTVGLYRM